ncbi:hypothetical protein PsorP6_000184 [Peronosclerospora sorghi]|uniref:Uncharacterized protein n=1 Tax=Peronosclerospora sorghi TaxID=230839 RepID=A0ACC0WQQ4_9STRA|nr:hypothetical protein PsorP6_000184 [Peronosclerospora sorghi]
MRARMRDQRALLDLKELKYLLKYTRRSVDEVCTPVCLRECAISAGNNTSITGSSGGSASPQSNPEFRALRGMCVATTFGTGKYLQIHYSILKKGDQSVPSRYFTVP